MYAFTLFKWIRNHECIFGREQICNKFRICTNSKSATNRSVEFKTNSNNDLMFIQINQIFKEKNPACCDVWWPTVEGIFFQIHEPFGGLVSVWPRKMTPLASTFFRAENLRQYPQLCETLFWTDLVERITV